MLEYFMNLNLCTNLALRGCYFRPIAKSGSIGRHLNRLIARATYRGQQAVVTLSEREARIACDAVGETSPTVFDWGYYLRTQAGTLKVIFDSEGLM